jgi:L-asparaginase II
VRVVLTRGPLRESEHAVRVAVWRGAGAGGTLLHARGDVATPVFLRSSAKVFQALASVVTGAADRFAMSDAELALACGSHNGEPFHAATAAGLLARIGLGADALLCGAHAPMHEPSAKALAARGEEPCALHNNCSGKHSNMLAACMAAGWTPADYVGEAHPLQVMNRAHMAAFCGGRAEDVVTGVDGCSAPNFAVPLAAAARGMARWMAPRAADGLDPAVAAAAERVAAALAKHPEMIAGTRRIDTDLIRVSGGRIIAKMGAEGVWLLGVRGSAADGSDATGIAIKCDDGAGRAPYPVGLAVLSTLGAVSSADREALAWWFDTSLRNHRKIVVGRIEIEPPTGV